jgi:hypothetical protein
MNASKETVSSADGTHPYFENGTVAALSDDGISLRKPDGEIVPISFVSLPQVKAGQDVSVLVRRVNAQIHGIRVDSEELGSTGDF